jgi:hypothetical protein
VFSGAMGALQQRANFRRRTWRPTLVRAGLLGEITPIDDRGFRARWTTEDGVDHEQGFRTLSAAVTPGGRAGRRGVALPRSTTHS